MATLLTLLFVKLGGPVPTSCPAASVTRLPKLWPIPWLECRETQTALALSPAGWSLPEPSCPSPPASPGVQSQEEHVWPHWATGTHAPGVVVCGIFPPSPYQCAVS